MGKGDIKTRKGKIYRGSHGNVRPHSGKSRAAATAPQPARPATRAPARPAAKVAPVRKPPAKRPAAKKPAA